MRKILSRVDEGRLGRAIAGLVTHTLVIQKIVRREKETCCRIQSTGVNGVKHYGVSIRCRRAFCSCEDYLSHGVLCKHIAALALHELGEAAAARSQRRELGVLMQR